MNNQRRALFLGVFLASTTIFAQPIHFSNGDILDVELIQHTDSTLTFLHSALGRQTINKAKISNLHDLNLVQLTKVPEGDEGIAFEKLRVAQERALSARQEVDIAKEKMIRAEKNAATATDVEIEVAERQAAAAEFNMAEESLIVAVDAVNAAEDEVKVAKNVKIANAQVAVAKDKSEIARQKFQLAQQAVKSADANLSKAKITHTEERLELAEEQLALAREELHASNEKLQTAENSVKLAKGEKVNDGFMGTGWFKDWDSSIELGMKGASGSSVNATFRTAFNAHYEDAQHRWDFHSFYLVDSEDNITGENQVHATLVKDWFFPETKWFAFASASYDWDEFKDWNHRLQLSAGPGYQFIKTQEWEFSGRIGGTGVFEFGKTVEDSFSPTGFTEKDIIHFDALIGADLIWHINAKQRFSLSNYFYTGLTKTGEYRNLTTLAWIHDIEWFEGLAIKFGIRNEYDTSETIPNEFKYNFSLLWGF